MVRLLNNTRIVSKVLEKKANDIGPLNGTYELNIEENSQNIKFTLDGNLTISFANWHTSTDSGGSGMQYIFMWIDPSVYSLTWPSDVYWDGGSAPSLDANTYNIVTFLRDNGIVYGGLGWSGLATV